MKKIFITLCIIACSCSAMNAQAFGKGDKQVTVGLGIGRINVNGEDAKEVAFDQHVGMEWGIANLTDKFSLGVGFEVINMWGGHNKNLINGHYDYDVISKFTIPNFRKS